MATSTSTPRLLPSVSLMARAFHRLPASRAPLVTKTQSFSSTSFSAKWKGSGTSAHITNESDTNNVQHDASREGKQERAEGSDNSAASSEKGKSAGEKTKKEHPEAPGPVIGMEDERGGKPK